MAEERDKDAAAASRNLRCGINVTQGAIVNPKAEF
jgi:hypothetical protein